MVESVSFDEATAARIIRAVRKVENMASGRSPGNGTQDFPPGLDSNSIVFQNVDVLSFEPGQVIAIGGASNPDMYNPDNLQSSFLVPGARALENIQDNLWGTAKFDPRVFGICQCYTAPGRRGNATISGLAKAKVTGMESARKGAYYLWPDFTTGYMTPTSMYTGFRALTKPERDEWALIQIDAASPIQSFYGRITGAQSTGASTPPYWEYSYIQVDFIGENRADVFNSDMWQDRGFFRGFAYNRVEGIDPLDAALTDALPDGTIALMVPIFTYPAPENRWHLCTFSMSLVGGEFHRTPDATVPDPVEGGLITQAPSMAVRSILTGLSLEYYDTQLIIRYRNVRRRDDGSWEFEDDAVSSVVITAEAGVPPKTVFFTLSGSTEAP